MVVLDLRDLVKLALELIGRGLGCDIWWVWGWGLGGGWVVNISTLFFFFGVKEFIYKDLV